MKWNIFAPKPHLYSTTQMYFMQDVASSFFQEKIRASDLFDDQNVILVDFKLKDQIVDVGSVQATLLAEIVMTYSGKVMEDFPSTLTSILDNETVESLVRKFVQDGFLGMSSTSSSVKYSSNNGSKVIANDSVDKYMIIFIVLITVSGVLALSTFTILISAKCRNDARRRSNNQRELKLAATTETEDPISPTGTGILGANIQRADGNAIITPQRNIVASYDETPMSMDSTFSDAKSAFSTTSSKAPLGIMSMNNLKKLMFSPERQKSTIALYNVGLDEDESHDENLRIEDEKRLDEESGS